MAQPTQQQLLLDLFPSKKTQSRSIKTKVEYRTGSTTAKMNALSKEERAFNGFPDKPAVKKIKYLLATEKNASNGLDTFQNDTSCMEWQAPHLGSNWANADKNLAPELVTSFLSKRKFDEGCALSVMQLENDRKFPKMEKGAFIDTTKERISRNGDEMLLTDGKCPDIIMDRAVDVKEERICRDSDEMFQRYKPRNSFKLERQCHFLSHFNLKRRDEIEEKEEQILESPNELNRQMMGKINSLSTLNRIWVGEAGEKRLENPLPPERYLSIDLCSPLGQQTWAKQSGYLNGTKAINIDALTSYCPKRISARNTKNSTKDSGNFVVTFKEPKEKKRIHARYSKANN